MISFKHHLPSRPKVSPISGGFELYSTFLNVLDCVAGRVEIVQVRAYRCHINQANVAVPPLVGTEILGYFIGTYPVATMYFCPRKINEYSAPITYTLPFRKRASPNTVQIVKNRS